MSDIKQKFDPSTHATRCGKQWRWLEVEGLSNLMAVDNGHREYLMFVDRSGYAGAAIGEPESIDRFDLIPIIHKPADLPDNLIEQIKYMAMDADKFWCGYHKMPSYYDDNEWRSISSDVWPTGCLNIPSDPAGPESSLHIRTDNGWERCGE